MEYLCKEVDEKIRVHVDSPEVKDIMKAVDILMHRFVDVLHEFSPATKIDRLQLCGSMAEGTRIWYPTEYLLNDLEFDYIAVMKSLPVSGSFVFKHCCEGAMEVMYEVTDPQSVQDKYVNLHEDIKSRFIEILVKGINAKCEKYFCTGTSGFQSGCKCCTVYMKTGNLRYSIGRGSQIAFVWSSIDKMTVNPFRYNKMLNASPDHAATDMFQIIVDFHPVIEVDISKVQPKDDGTGLPLIKENTYFVFPKHCYPACSNKCWRISTCQTELQLLTETSKEHILAFCVLKFIGQSVELDGYGGYVQQYEAKCVVLNHIKWCKTPYIGAHVCLLQMMKDIYKCGTSFFLQHPVLPYNLHCVLSTREYKYKHTNFHKTLYLLFASQKDIYSINDFLNDNKSLAVLECGMRNERGRSFIDLRSLLTKRNKATPEVVLKELNERYPNYRIDNIMELAV
ncbi:uncharacterized protein LOC123549470 [Mercenaria mercenaria]|uniref:uncharacterized protein LOC123549470 n=1 Tax=Mercenaria mercenaria TaxID=6596 RepID=UPI00234F0193|nr:uncharacterized protein LOC123549470 [Mercenaria mercenaria]